MQKSKQTKLSFGGKPAASSFAEKKEKPAQMDAAKVNAPSKRGMEDITISKAVPEEEVIETGKRRKLTKVDDEKCEKIDAQVPEPDQKEETKEIDDGVLKPYDDLREPSDENFCPVKDSPQR